MSASATGDAQSLPEFLAARARRASDLRLVLNAGAGLVALITAIITRPPFWVSLMTLGASFLAYGAWGILDRELTTAEPGRHPALTFARTVVTGLGALAGIGFLLTFFFQFVGSWIS